MDDANCMECHDTGIYTRKDRLVGSLDALQKRLGDCSHMAKKEFSAIETQNIIKYLNDQFYQFRFFQTKLKVGKHRCVPRTARRNPLKIRLTSAFDMIAKVAGRTVSVEVILRPSDFSFGLL